MEVAGAHAGYVALGGVDVQQFAVNLESFHAEDYVDSLFLHSLAPLDVALLVESCHQFDHSRNLLAVAGGTDERLHHLRVLGKTIECGLYLLHAGAQSSLAQQSDVCVERVVGHVYEAVFLAYLLEERLLGEEFGLHHGLPLLIFQFIVAAVGKRHEVAVVLIASCCERSVKFAHVKTVENALLHVAWHVLVVYHSDWFATLSRVHTERNLLHSAVVGIVVYFHFGILGELEGVGFVCRRLGADEYQRQTEAYDVVEIHDVVEAVALRYAYEAAVHAVGNLDDGILHLALRVGVRLLHYEVYAVVLKRVEVVDGREPDRIGRAVELVVIQTLEELLLLVVELGLLKQTDVVLFEFGEYALYHLGVF